MPGSTLKDKYRDASIHIQNVEGAESKATLESYRWKLYGLHKQVMEGDCPHSDSATTTSTTLLNKWNAWVACKGMSREESMESFISIVKLIDPSYSFGAGKKPPRGGADMTDALMATSSKYLAQQRNIVSKTGLMRKKSDWRKNWDPRYFSLQKGILSYFLKKSDAEPRNSLVIRECDIMKRTESVTIDGKSHYGFSVAHAGMRISWALMCDDLEDRNEWVNVLQEVKGVPSTRVLDNAVGSSAASTSFSSGSAASTDDDSATAGVAGDAGSVAGSPTENIPRQFLQPLEECIRNLLDGAAADNAAADGRAAGKSGSDGWEQMYVKGSLTASRKPGESIMVKGTAVLPFSIKDIFSVVADISQLHQINPQVDRTAKLLTFNRQTSTNHIVFKQVWPTAVRDMVNFTHWRLMPNGTLVIASFNAETFHSGQNGQYVPAQGGDNISVPSPKGAVRANLMMGGYVLVPDIKAGNTRVSYVVSSDLMGRIPTSVSNHVARNQPLIVLAILKELEAIPQAKRTSVNELPDFAGLLSITQAAAVNSKPLFGAYAPNKSALKRENSPNTAEATRAAKREKEREKPPKTIFLTLLLPVLLACVMERHALGFLIGCFISLPYIHKQLLVGQLVENKYTNNVEFSNALPRGRVIVQFSVDLGKLLRYVDSKREGYGMDISLTHVIAKAAANALFSFQALNGCMIGSHFYRSPSNAISISVSAENSDMIAVKIDDANTKTLNVIADELQAKSRSVRRALTTGAGAGGGEKAVAGTTVSGGGPSSRAGILLDALPLGISYSARYILRLIASYYGMAFPSLGITPYPHGTCNIITSPRDPARPDAMELDVGVVMVPETDSMLSAPPVVITIGGISLKTTLDAERKTASSPVLNLAVSIDCRAVGFAQGRQFASVLQKYMTDFQDE